MNAQYFYQRSLSKILVVYIILLTSITGLNAQVIFEENFNGANGSTSGTANGVNWSSSCPACVSGDYWEIKNGVFEGNDTNGEAFWQTDTPIDISNCGSIDISFDIESVGSMEDCNTGCNSVDFVRLQYNIDGGGWQDPSNSYFCGGPCAGINVVASGNTPLINYSTGCIPTTGNNLQMRISVQTWAGSEYWRIDDVTVNCGSSNAGTSANVDICSSSTTPINLFNELGGNPDTNGSWSGSSTLTGGNLGTFDPATMNAGVYTYTVGSGNCQESANVTVNFISAGDPGINNTIDLCDNGLPIDLFNELGGTPDNTGTWSGSSNLAGGNLGTFNPVTMTAGTYTYTVGTTTCQSSSTVVVNIILTGNAGANAIVDICDNAPSIDLFNELGGTPDNTGVWTGPSTLMGGSLGTFNPLTMNPGVYTYTTGSGVCLNNSTVTINLTSSGNSGISNTIELCDNGLPINLFNELGGTPDNTGTWVGPSSPTGGNLGTFDPATMNAGIYTYTTGTAACQSSSTVTVNIGTIGNSGGNSVIDLCDNSLSINLFGELLGTPDNTGTWSGPSTLAGGNLGTFDPTTMNAGIYTYTVGTAICQVSSTVTVNLTSSGNSGTSNVIDLCDNGTPIDLFNELGGTPDNTGTWSGSSTLTGGNLGTFDPAAMNAGIYTYTVGTALCFNSSTVTVNINSAGNSGVNSVVDLCDNALAINLFDELGGNPDLNGTWSGPSNLNGGDLGTFDANTMNAGVYTYSVGVAPCLSNSTVSVNIISSGNSGNINILDLCDNDQPINLYGELGGTPTTNGTWSGPSNLTGGHLGGFDASVMNSGTYNYTSINAVGCLYSGDIQIVVNVVQEPSFTSDFQEICGPQTVSFTNTSAQNSNNCLWDFGNGFTSSNCSNVANYYSNEGEYDVTLTITDNNGCVGSQTKNNYIKITPFPIANFSTDRVSLPNGEADVNFTNESSNANNFTWNFGDGSANANTYNAFHTYNSTGEKFFTVVLEVSNDIGCSDTDSLVLTVEDEVIYYVPNSFTPNNDGNNAIFKPVFTSGFDPQNYSLLIYNRWGEILFESKNSEIGWDGTYGNSLVESGTYIWVIRYHESNSTKKHLEKGVVNLLK